MADENKRIITREFLASVLKKIVNKIGLRLKKEDAWKNYYKNLSGNIDLNRVIETGKYIYNGSSTSVLNIPNTSLKEADDINEYQIGARDTFMLEVYSTKDTDSVKRLIQVIYIGNFGEKKVFYRYTKNPNKNETDTDWVWSKWNTGFGGTTEIVCINGKNIDTELKGNVTFFSVPGYSQDFTTVGKGQGVLGTLPSDIPNIYDIPNYSGQESQISSGVINGYQLEDNYQTIQVIYINGKSYRRSKWLKHEYFFNGDVPPGKNKINIEMSDWTEWTTQPTKVSNSLNTIEAGTVPSTKLITQNNNIISKLFSDSLYLNNTDDSGNYNSFNKFPLSRATKNGIYWAGNKFYICIRDYSGATISAPNNNFEEFSLAKIFDKVRKPKDVKLLAEKIYTTPLQSGQRFDKVIEATNIKNEMENYSFIYISISSNDISMQNSLHYSNKEYFRYFITLTAGSIRIVHISFAIENNNVVFGNTFDCGYPMIRIISFYGVNF